MERWKWRSSGQIKRIISKWWGKEERFPLILEVQKKLIMGLDENNLFWLIRKHNNLALLSFKDGRKISKHKIFSRLKI